MISSYNSCFSFEFVCRKIQNKNASIKKNVSRFSARYEDDRIATVTLFAISNVIDVECIMLSPNIWMMIRCSVGPWRQFDQVDWAWCHCSPGNGPQTISHFQFYSDGTVEAIYSSSAPIYTYWWYNICWSCWGDVYRYSFQSVHLSGGLQLP